MVIYANLQKGNLILGRYNIKELRINIFYSNWSLKHHGFNYLEPILQFWSTFLKIFCKNYSTYIFIIKKTIGSIQIILIFLWFVQNVFI